MSQGLEVVQRLFTAVRLSDVEGLLACYDTVTPTAGRGPTDQAVRVGDWCRCREVTDICGYAVPLPEPGWIVHLQFRRYAGCPVCNVHLRSFTDRHAELLEARIREIVCFTPPQRPCWVPEPAALRGAAFALTRSPSLRGAAGLGEHHMGLPADPSRSAGSSASGALWGRGR